MTHLGPPRPSALPAFKRPKRTSCTLSVFLEEDNKVTFSSSDSTVTVLARNSSSRFRQPTGASH